MGIETAEMNEGGQTIIVNRISFAEIAGELTKTRPFASTAVDALNGIDSGHGE